MSATVYREYVDIVKYAKEDGTLKLLPTCIEWTRKSSPKVVVQISYKDINELPVFNMGLHPAQRISPESSLKVQIQIIHVDGSAHVFHFSCREGREAEIKHRNEAKDLIAKLIPLHKGTTDKQLEEKSRLLQSSAELYSLYKDLVTSDIMSADEFWGLFAAGYTQKDTDSANQDVGISSGFMVTSHVSLSSFVRCYRMKKKCRWSHTFLKSDIQPDMHGCNELRFSLTADSIEAIFYAYPSVRKKYQQKVPQLLKIQSIVLERSFLRQQMTEKEFWTQFFQSQYFHRDRLGKNRPANDIFVDCAKDDDLEHTKLKEAFKEEPLIDLSNSCPIDEEGFGLGPRTSQANGSTLVRRFNLQSQMLLKKSCERKREPPADDVTNYKKAKLEVAVFYDDLEEVEASKPGPMVTIDRDKFGRMATTDQLEGVPAGSELEDMTSHAQKITILLSEVDGSITAAGVDLAFGLPSFSPNTSLPKPEYESANLEELQQMYLTASELLRHFWMCFPVTSEALEQKVSKMARCIEKFQEHKLLPWIQSLCPTAASLGSHITEMISVATSKYTSWSSRRVVHKPAS